MGFGLRFKEKVKQVGKKSNQPDKNGFIPTNYERVELTYKEASDFADSLKTIRKRIVDAHTARTKMLKEIEKTLTGSLPRIHEIDPVTGEHHTSEAAPEAHEGDYVHTGTLTRLVDENDVKVQNQVFAPIDKWISEVDLFSKKMKNLETMRLELDGSRRDHINIENKIAKQEAKQAEVDAKHTTHIQSKDASIAGKRSAFENYEASLYEELTNLVGESGVLHSALDRALKLEVEVLQRAADPIASTTARLETLSSASGGGTPISSIPSGSAATGYAPSTGYAASTTTFAPSAPGYAPPSVPGTGPQYGGASYGAQSGPTTAATGPVGYEKPYAA